MKGVLIVGSFVGSGPLSRYVGGALSERLGAAGWNSVVTSRSTSRLGRVADMTATALRARRLYSVALVEVYSGPAFRWAEWVCLLLRMLGKPYILALHGGDLPRFASTHPDRVRKLLGSASKVVSPSAYLATELGWLGTAIGIMPNPLEPDAYPFRQRSGGGRHLLWLRAFHAIYNPSMFPRVLARLAKDHPAVRGTMIGPDKGDGSLAEVRRVAEELGVAGRMDLVPGIPHHEVGAWMDRADIFVSTTNYDNTPVSVLEAMACGLPVVSTAVGGVPYLLSEGATGLLVPAGDDGAMERAILRLFEDPGLVSRLSSGGRTQVEGYAWSRILPKWTDLLASVAACEPARGAVGGGGPDVSPEQDARRSGRR